MEKQTDTKSNKQNITQQLNGLVLPVFIIMAVIVGVFSILLLYLNYRYEDAMQSAVIAADFNRGFKDSIDLAMYNHVIQPRTPTSIAKLPMDELEQAEEVLHRLETATNLPDNQCRVC